MLILEYVSMIGCIRTACGHSIIYRFLGSTPTSPNQNPDMGPEICL